MPPESHAPEPAARSLRRLFKGLERRHGMDGAARIEIDKQLLDVVDDFASLDAASPRDALEGPPPRAVAVALASAIYAQPHLAVVFGDIAPVGTEPFESPVAVDAERPVLMSTEALSEALGLPGWELDDIREDIDRRVGAVLKQARALRWLWTHFGLPDASPEGLFRVLFPGAPQRMGQLAFVRRGAQLYALAQQDSPPPAESLFLPWVPVDPERSMHPLRSFGGRYVNANVRRALARGIGASDDEVIGLLDRMVTVLPRNQSGSWMHRDAWRARGFSSLTDLPAPYGHCAWLSQPVAASDLSYSAFLRTERDDLVVHDARSAFDVLAVARANEAIRQVYGEMLSRLQHDRGEGPATSPADLVPLDVERHLRAVLSPLVEWAGNPRTHAWVASSAGVSLDRATRALQAVRHEWNEQLEAAWLGAPGDGHPFSAQALIASHLLQIRRGLRAQLVREADARSAHRDVLLLFAGYYLGHQPLERMWNEASESSTWPSAPQLTEPFGAWFWGAWQRVLAHWEDDTTLP